MRIPEEFVNGAVRIEHWDDDEYVISWKGQVIGQTLHLKDAIIAARWFKTVAPDFEWIEKL